MVDTWVDRILFAGVGALGLLSSSVLLLAAAVVDPVDAEGVRNTLLAVGFFGLVISSVMQMRTVAQVLRRADVSDAGAAEGGRRV